MSARATTADPADARLARRLLLPALGVIAAVVGFPLCWMVWESLHLHDLRMPWLGRPFVGLANYRDAIADQRFRTAVTHTVLFVIVSVTLELVGGFVLALAMRRATRGRAALRVLILLPWAIPTAASALVWRFLFDSQAGLVNEVLVSAHVLHAPRVWLVDPMLAWIPIVAADVWKTTPFVALLLLAGLQNIDESLYDAARIDGATPWRELVEITLPLLEPAIVVALAFRALDAFRVFDLIYVLTGGGPGTATESVSLYTFSTLLQKLRFGYASALSVIVFAATFGLGLIYIRVSGGHLLKVER
ncbi:MAG TPA: sugar ABC transporter permease [Vicinamibacterales bacterium]|nr:sugar ABC transporter permease [Vicinamibacterales bacterium]